MTQTKSVAPASRTGKWKPYPAYRDSDVEWLGKIPAHWGIGKIGAACTVKARLGWRGLKASEYVHEGYIFLSTPNIKDSEIDFENVNYITAERYFESPEIILKVGDVLIAKDGSTLGITTVVRHLPAPTTVNSSIAVIRPYKLLDSVFLYWFLSCNYIQGFIQRMKDGMGVPHLFQADLRKFVALIPSFEEQRTIAAFLDRETARINVLIAKKERLIELLQEKRAALISHAVTKGLDPTVPMKDSGVESLGEIPAHWEVKRLKFIATEPLKYGANEPAELEDTNLPRYIRITDIDEGGFLRNDTFRSVPEDIAEPYLLKAGDLLFARSGATVGKSFMYRDSWGRACYAGYLIRARINSQLARSEFISYFTTSPIYWNWLDSVFSQATIQNVNAEKYSNLFVTIPPLEEQQLIATYLDCETAKIDALISRIRDGIEKLKEYSTALISAAVTGKIDVRETIGDHSENP